MNDGHEMNPLDWLDPRSSAPSGRLREAVLAQTQGVLRRRRLVRRGIRVTSFVVIYFAGIASMELWSRLGRNDLGAGPPDVANASNTSADSTIKATPGPGAMQSATEQSHSQMRPKTKFEAMRDAADRVWETSGDIALAARLYGRAVRNASTTELAVSARDNWLLLSLKEARIQEMKHVQADL